MTEKEKMIKGLIYDAEDKELCALRIDAAHLYKKFNNSFEEGSVERINILKQLLGSIGERSFLRGPLYFDYGFNTFIGSDSYANFNFTVLDVCPVHIGNNVFIANNVSLVTALHPLLAEERKMSFDKETGCFHSLEYGKPITIEDGVWICANVTVGPGVTIGKNSVIGMGSNVVNDIPPNSLAYGNPCRVVRELTEKDSIKYRKELFSDGDK